MDEAPILHIRGLSKHIEEEQGEKRILFREVSAQIDASSRVALMGASGQGKSTLLRIIGMLDKPDSGTIHFRGQSQQAILPSVWRRKIGFVAQHAVMLEGTVESNLKTASLLHKEKFETALSRELMEKVGLGQMDWNKRAADLSGGEKQRVALVRSLLLKPELFLLDEITASLDTHSKHAVEQLMLEWHNEYGTPMIWVTHDLDQARMNSNLVWYMAEHTLLESTPTDQFFVRPATAQARSFLELPEEMEGS